MAQTIFLTGGTGFVGTVLRARLAGPDWQLRGVARRPDAPGFVAGDLLSPDGWREALRGADAVVHMAALTGPAAPADHRRVNLEGTRGLIAACREAGVSRMVFVSTIAAGYADQRHYPYAQSKLAAERLVRESGLDFTILRPTIVLGAGSPIWDTLCRIAGLPVVPLPQGRDPVKVQPVDVGDLARAIEIVLTERRFDGETLDIGGPDPEDFADWLRSVRRATKGAAAPIVRTPLAPIRAGLALVEPALRRFLPVTAGQLALFANDSVAADNWLMDRMRPTMVDNGALLRRLAGPAAVSAAPVSAESPVAGPDDIARLTAECDGFARYLTGASPSADALRHYVAACQAHGVARDEELPRFDRLSLALARKGPWLARCIDAACSLLRRRGALRRRLIILSAIVENQTPTNDIYEARQAPGPFGAVLMLAGHGLAFAAALASGLVLLGAGRIAGVGRG